MKTTRTCNGDPWRGLVGDARSHRRQRDRKTRPCLIVSPSEMHDHLRTAIVAPMTTGGQPAPYRIPVTFGAKKGLILLDQIRTLDQARLIKRVGAVHDRTLASTLNTLQEVFNT